MTEAAPSVDFRQKFLKVFGYTVIALTIGVVIWGVMSLGMRLFGEAKHLRCQSNLKTIMGAMSIYRQTYRSQLPPYLAALLPLMQNRIDKLQCPADTNHGANGCRPLWMRPYYTDRDFGNVDLDGPTLDPGSARDNVPCSYLYAANGYPCGLDDSGRTWREVFESQVRQLGVQVPMVRCYYHLPEQYVQDPEFPGGRRPDPNAAPTYNITADLELKRYPLGWQSAFRSSPPR